MNALLTPFELLFLSFLRYNKLVMIKKILAVSAAAIVAGALAFSGCKTEEEEGKLNRYSRTFYAFGTEATFALYSDFDSKEAQDEAIALGKQIEQVLTSLENKLSVSVEGSDIYNFNAADPGARVEISEDTYNVLELALELYEETDGAYNAGVYYSVDLYGFAARADDVVLPYDRDDVSKQLPEQKYVSAFCELSQSFGDISLESADGKYYVVKPEKTVTVEGDSTEYSLKIDLGGIGKGYTVDVIDKMMEDAGYSDSYISFGSSSWNINGSATSEDGKWDLGFRDPRGSIVDYYFSVRLKDSAVSTSGDYEQYYEIDGKRYCHIINPATGSPIQTGIITATCLGGTAAEADARTTALCAMGLEKAVEYINTVGKQNNLKITLAYQSEDGNLYFVTNIPEGEYQLVSDNYTIASTINEDGDVVLTKNI